MLIARIVKDDQTKIQVAKSAPNTGQASYRNLRIDSERPNLY